MADKRNYEFCRYVDLLFTLLRRHLNAFILLYQEFEDSRSQDDQSIRKLLDSVTNVIENNQHEGGGADLQAQLQAMHRIMLRASSRTRDLLMLFKEQIKTVSKPLLPIDLSFYESYSQQVEQLLYFRKDKSYVQATLRFIGLLKLQLTSVKEILIDHLNHTVQKQVRPSGLFEEQSLQDKEETQTVPAPVLVPCRQQTPRQPVTVCSPEPQVQSKSQNQPKTAKGWQLIKDDEFQRKLDQERIRAKGNRIRKQIQFKIDQQDNLIQDKQVRNNVITEKFQRQFDANLDKKKRAKGRLFTKVKILGKVQKPAPFQRTRIIPRRANQFERKPLAKNQVQVQFRKRTKKVSTISRSSQPNESSQFKRKPSICSPTILYNSATATPQINFSAKVRKFTAFFQRKDENISEQIPNFQSSNKLRMSLKLIRSEPQLADVEAAPQHNSIQQLQREQPAKVGSFSKSAFNKKQRWQGKARLRLEEARAEYEWLGALNKNLKLY